MLPNLVNNICQELLLITLVNNFLLSTLAENFYIQLLLTIFVNCYIKQLLSKPQPQHNTTVGFDMKMTVQTTPPPTETFQPLLDQLES